MQALARDVRGNTLAMMAAALIPMIALAGSAIDVSRSYMVKVRLQQACDAGALAARKAMTGSTLDTTSTAAGNNLFNFNFADGMFQATNTVFTPTATSDGQVTATATTRVPMTLMKIFNQQYVDLSVSCDAKLEIANTDVVIVLDDTGSMLDCPDDSYCNGNSNSKIAGLRTAVVNFFNTVQNATSSTARFRIGFVPYSSSVNVGSILQSSWLVSNWTYQSRVANMTTPHYNRTLNPGSPVDTVETASGSLNINSKNKCQTYGANKSYPTLDGSQFTSGTDPGVVTVTTYSYKSWTSSTHTCTRTKSVSTYTSVFDGYAFTDWTYKPVSYNVANFVNGNTVNVYTGSGAPSGTVLVSGSYDMYSLVNTLGSTVPGTATTWNRCVEERDTVATDTSPYYTTGSYDVDITTVPSGTSTQWRPIWGELVYDRANSSNETNVTTNRSPEGAACPPAVQKLTVSTTSDVQNYVNNLSPTGTTFHDAGMVWGLRLLSPSGLFSSENTTAPNGKPISRHIIFMTDGLMNADITAYSDHGYEKLDKRVNGTTATVSTSNQNTRHTARFLALCDLARTQNITVWTVAFGTSNPSSLLSCANNDSSKSFVATSAASLNSQFQTIASQISDLRLSR